MNEWLVLQNGSDIRGVASEGVAGQAVNLTDPVVRAIGCAFSRWLGQRLGGAGNSLRIAVGQDSRISAERIKQAMGAGIATTGARIHDCGLASTPAMFMSTIFPGHGYDGAIMLTASHLPFNRNGMKFFTADGGLEKQDIRDILLLAAEIGEMHRLPDAELKPVDLMADYADHLVQIIRDGSGLDNPLTGLRIIVDAGNGAGGFFVDKVLQPLGADTTGSQFLEPDGRFPNHVPNPEDKTAMAAVCSAVTRNNADLGIIFDTDVDRAAAVDHRGEPINRNRFIALMAAIVLEDHPGSTIVTDSVTSNGLKWWIETKLGGVHHRFQRGYRNVIREAIRLNDSGRESWLAMETSGHGALKENYFLDDGAYQIAKILIKISHLKRQGQTLERLIEELPEPLEAAELRIRITADDFSSYADRVLAEFADYAARIPGWSLTPNNYEGVHVSCDRNSGNGWALLRKSLHDPQLPLNIESETSGGARLIADRIRRFLVRFKELDVPGNP